MALRQDSGAINISGISVSGVGGLGLVAVAALMTWVFPQAWWLVVLGASGGSALGLAIIAFRRHHTPSGPSGNDPHVLFRAADENRLAGLPTNKDQHDRELCSSVLVCGR